ncbi:glucan biosynthesis protein D [Polymorphobacter glacialis]|uniref:Glucan biosynthesis protein D n=1 Tax=Sandarakinorhabdus glacialis TaxID=1614636 RepID=A0A916ZLP7_9SPHN|nr:glucan biosynthesis protein [Polymorphobacter glacialis]GGE02524.1 glucan biosynthesis protein D [Polymorphobacter glacialis]
MSGKTAISRRSAFGLLAGLAAYPALGAAGERLGPAQAFSWELLVGRAKALAGKPYATPRVSQRQAQDFDAAGRLTFGEAGRLAGLVRLLPAPRNSPNIVGIHIVEGRKARTLTSLDGMFAGGGVADPAGFRVLAANLQTDWLAYQGASYFRSSGSRDQYGLSARGIAVDTGLSGPEEFPLFTDFWIERITDTHFIVHALLDGPSLAGVFAFDNRLGPDGVTQDVKSALFIRKDIRRLGIAPATSMFWYDEGQRRQAVDWRPEIHDSDGLAIWSATGERIWRPLGNPEGLRTSSFRADGLKGFGLVQRDQSFDSYQDDGARYDRRPSLWIEPAGNWGPGAVQLFEIPTESETMDNIVAFWVGDRPARAGERRDFRYRLRWTSADPSDGGTARAVNVWIGAGGIPGAPPVAGARKYVVDLQGPALVGLTRTSKVEAVINLEPPAMANLSAYPVVGQQDLWRVAVDVMPHKTSAKELRLYLRRGASALSETVIEPFSS